MAARESNILILGAGHFGRRAAAGLGTRFPDAAITVVDRDPVRCRSLSPAAGRGVCAEAVRYLNDRMHGEDPDWIVPAVPLHLAFYWLRRRVRETFRLQVVPVPRRIRDGLPHCWETTDGGLVASIADFRCPEDCPEPAENCTRTGRPRPLTLFRYLRRAGTAPCPTVVIRSRQLLPGVGGFRPDDLRAARIAVLRSAGPVLLATACRCHGALHAFRLLPVAGARRGTAAP